MNMLGSIEPHKIAIGVRVAGAPHRKWGLLVAWCGFVIVAVAYYNRSEFDELVQYLHALATTQLHFFSQIVVAIMRIPS